MAYVVAKAGGTFEIRESRATARGPRSRTLASFRELTPAVIEKAAARALEPLDPAELRRAAHRKGAPVASPPSDLGAAELLRELEAGRPPRAPLASLLQEALSGIARRANSNAAAAAAWIGATPQRRGEALHDLLLLVDSLPDRSRQRASKRRTDAPRTTPRALRPRASRPPFPRIESRAA